MRTGRGAGGAGPGRGAGGIGTGRGTGGIGTGRGTGSIGTTRGARAIGEARGTGNAETAECTGPGGRAGTGRRGSSWRIVGQAGGAARTAVGGHVSGWAGSCGDQRV